MRRAIFLAGNFIIGASSIAQLEDNVQAIDVKLDATTIVYLNEPDRAREPIMI